MSCWVYVVTRNEAVLLPYFLRHYSTFCERIIIYDDHSDDGTPEAARLLGAEVRACPWSGLDDAALVEFAAQQYLEARGQADWVIWVDADEFIYHRRLPGYLADLHTTGITLPNIQGYNMVAEHPPIGAGQIYDEIKVGFADTVYSKPVVFDPRLDLHWTTGRHQVSNDWMSRAILRTPMPEGPLLLLHYRYLGAAWHLARNVRNYSVMNVANIQARHGNETYPGATGDHSPAWYAEQVKNAHDVIG